MKKAIFLDRDGTINYDYGYVSSPEKFKLLKYAAPSLYELQKMGYLLIIITNQSGIGRNYYKLEDFHKVNKKMFELLSRYKVKINDIFFCPHPPEENCICRKPSPEMVFRAAEKWKINIKESFFIGDKVTDILCGKNAGCTTIKIENSKYRQTADVIEQGDYKVENLKEALAVIKKLSLLKKQKKATAVIPARIGSTRLKEKIIKKAKKIPLIEYTYKNAKSMNIFKEIFIATDSVKIQKICKKFNAKCILTKKSHQSGTSRISEIYKKVKTPYIINIQADEPLISIAHIEKLITSLSNSKNALVSTAMSKIKNIKEEKNPNIVKVVFDKDNFALYFSRYPIPYKRSGAFEIPKYKHIGIYGYKRSFFNKYKKFKISELELSEKLEQLTFLYNKIKIKLAEVENETIGIDTEEEFEEFENLVEKHKTFFKNLIKNN